MIVTLQPQVIDAQNRIEEVVLFKIASKSENPTAKTVIFDVEQYILVKAKYPQERPVLNNGAPMFNEQGMIKKTMNIENCQLVKIATKKEVISADVFEKHFSDIKQSDWEEAFIKQIEYRNSNQSKPGEMPNFYWNLKGKDLEIVSDDEIKQILGEKVID